MSGYLLDTNVVSELTRDAPCGRYTERQALRWPRCRYCKSVEDAMTVLTEVDVEQAALVWLSDHGRVTDLNCAVTHGPNIAPETPNIDSIPTIRWC